MQTNEFYSMSANKNIPDYILDGNMEISCLSNSLSALSFSLIDLKNFQEIDEKYLKIDFNRWEKIVNKNKECYVAFACMKEFENCMKEHFYFEEDDTLVMSFNKDKDGKDKALAIASLIPFEILNYKKQILEEDKSNKRSEWVIQNGSLINNSLKVNIDEFSKIKIFSIITEYFNKEVYWAEELVDSQLNKYSPFLRLINIQERMPIVSEIIDEVYKKAYSYNTDKLNKLAKKLLGIQKVKCI